MSPLMKAALIYVAVISFISVIVCIYDKLISKLNRVGLRVPEKILFVLSALGGSAAMFITMLIVRHKTKHKRFMIGIPVMIVCQAVLIALLMLGRALLNFLA